MGVRFDPAPLRQPDSPVADRHRWPDPCQHWDLLLRIVPCAAFAGHLYLSNGYGTGLAATSPYIRDRRVFHTPQLNVLTRWVDAPAGEYALSVDLWQQHRG